VVSRYVEASIVIVWTHRHKEKNPYIEGIYSTLKVPVRQAGKYFIKGAPLLVIVRRDMAKALGQRLAALLGARRPVAVLDGISADQGTFIDLGRPVMDGMALPVVVKTLLFG